MSNHAKCPECKDYITPLDTIEGCWRDTPDHVQQKFIEVERQRNQGEKTDE